MQNTVRHLLSIAGLLIGICGFGQTYKRVNHLAYADSARLVTIFKDLHQNPELAFMEVRTAGIVANELKNIGYEVLTGIAKTGVAAILKNGNGPVVMYRADMDCNAVKETTGLPYASNKTMPNNAGLEVPVMHACGHDAHITWMLGAAKIMASLKKEWSGTLVFIAQPGEELGLGSRAMLDDGLFEKGVPVPDYLFGMHSFPLPVGTIDNAAGDRMAGTDQLDVQFFGVGGHGASPEFTKDPVLMASNAVLQYQSIVSRNIAAQDIAVITVGAFSAGNSNNIIPATALLKLNLRWFKDTIRNTLLQRIKAINEGIAVANDLPKDKYPAINIKMTAVPLTNDKQITERVNAALRNSLSKPTVITDRPALMISEDFQYLGLANKKTVYDYAFVGIAAKDAVDNAAKEGKQYPFYNHNGDYRVDLSAIPLGTETAVVALLELLKK